MEAHDVHAVQWFLDLYIWTPISWSMYSNSGIFSTPLRGDDKCDQTDSFQFTIVLQIVPYQVQQKPNTKTYAKVVNNVFVLKHASATYSFVSLIFCPTLACDC